MLLAVGKASVLAVTGLTLLGSGVVVMRHARRLARASTAMGTRRYVWKIDTRVDTEAPPLPSRFNRVSGGDAPVLADELKDFKLPPGPESVGLVVSTPDAAPAHEATTATGSSAESDPGEAERDPGDIDGDPQETLPLAFGSTRSEVDRDDITDVGVQADAPPAAIMAPQTSDVAADAGTDGDAAPDVIVSWQTPALEGDAAPAASVDAESATDYATLVGEYLSKLRRRRR